MTIMCLFVRNQRLRHLSYIDRWVILGEWSQATYLGNESTEDKDDDEEGCQETNAHPGAIVEQHIPAIRKQIH